jgi:glycogenin glucosyltransferase
VTLATNDSYALGALVLAHSLKRTGTTRKIVIMVTSEGMSQPMRSQLADVFDEVVDVTVIDSEDQVNLTLLDRPELGITFTKLHCWCLVQYSKCVFLDADTLVSTVGSLGGLCSSCSVTRSFEKSPFLFEDAKI